MNLSEFKNAKFFVCTFLFFVSVGMFFCVGTVRAEETGVTQSAEVSRKLDLKSPVITYMGATSNGVIKIKWKKVAGAEKYVIYRAESKKGTYKNIGTSSKTCYSDKKGKKGKSYYYKIAAAFKDGQTGEWEESTQSVAKKGTVRKTAKRIAYVGDSIMTGFSLYHVTGKGTKVFAKIGINATTFYNSSLMGQMLNYKPDRMVLMFGMNGLAGNPGSGSMQTQINCIGSIIKKCRKKNPEMEIIIMGVSPVSASTSVKMSNVRMFNRMLKKSLKKHKDVHYYDLSKILASSGGYLSSSYNGGDGIHWNSAAYKKVYKAINQYVKEWEL